VIDDAGHLAAVDQPEAFERALAGALHRSRA
jgi:pimeloyl-ACP methyl ester carboxylesterase